MHFYISWNKETYDLSQAENMLFPICQHENEDTSIENLIFAEQVEQVVKRRI